MEKRQRLLFAVLSILAGALITGSAVYLALIHTQTEEPFAGQVDQPIQEAETQQKNRTIVYLYFADKNNAFLVAEERKLHHPDDSVTFGSAIIKALIKGPQKNLLQTVPEGTILNAFFVTDDKTAYVDLSETIRDKHPGGLQSEQMTIYSIVNSLVLNIPEIEQVKILIGGRESMTLAGHIDLRFPFNANMLIVR